MKTHSVFFPTLIALFLAFLASIVFRHSINLAVLEYTTQTLTSLAHLWLQVGFWIGIACFCGVTFFYKKSGHRWFLPFWVALGLSLLIGLFLEQILFSDTSQQVLNHYFPLRRPITFPSLHILLASGIVLPFLRAHRHYIWVLALFLLITAWAELASFNHVLSDIFGAMLIGLTTARYILYLEDDFKGISIVSTALHKDLEMRRQIAHALLGVIIVVGLYLGIFDVLTLGLLFILGYTLSIATKRWNVPLIYPLLRFFERETHLRKFPGKGPIFFILGSFLSLLLFPFDIALASILILGIGDSFTNLLGREFGRTPFFYNPKKNIEGPLYATILAGISASFFAPIGFSFVASAVALFVESLPLRIGGINIDDNLTIPLVAGGTLMFLQQLFGMV